MDAASLPADKGTYVLILRLDRAVQMTIGRLGSFALPAGHYAYVGSAFGSGGLRARIGHHLEPAGRPHWHIDYLRQRCSPVEVWFSAEPARLERRWADTLQHLPCCRVPVPGFGSSEYHRSHRTHLFYSKHKPSFEAFGRRIGARVERPIHLRQLSLQQV